MLPKKFQRTQNVTERRLKVRFSAAAREDLRAITRFTIDKFGVRQAKIYGQSITSVIEKIQINPNLGIFRPELAEGLQSIVHQSHVVFFKLDGVYLSIIRILHHSRDISRYF